MKVYFDESYPASTEKLILGALFLPNRATSYLHNGLLSIKNAHGIVGELKYASMKSKKQLLAAQDILNLFLNMRDGYFRSMIIPYNANSLAIMPGNELDKKRLGIYVDSATKLIINNFLPSSRVDVFMDEESRLEKIKFYKKLEKIKPQNKAKINSVTAVKSHDDSNCLMQLCDLLTGGILQNLYPTVGKMGKYKKLFGEFYKAQLNILDFEKETWNAISIAKARRNGMKVHVGYWNVPDFAKYLLKKNKKSRS